MRNISNLSKGESGQVLIFVTIILLLSALIIPPMLSLNFSGIRLAQIRESRMLELYAADAGIEDALYKLHRMDELELDEIANLQFGDIYDVQMPPLNDATLNVAVEKAWLPDALGYPLPVSGDTDVSDNLVMVGMLVTAVIDTASDDLESGDFAGGTGWINGDPWTTSGDVSVINAADAYQGNWYLGFRKAVGDARRAVDLSSNDNPRLQFYAKAGNFQVGDEVRLKVTPDAGGGTWTTVKTWTLGDDDDIYKLIDIDLSSFPMSSEFWIDFDAELSGGTVASDDFESGGFAGGSGWLEDWSHSGDSSVRSDGRQHSGNYHLRLRRSSGYVEREVDLSTHAEARLQFWARVRSFESNDRAWLKVNDGDRWHDVKDWTSDDSDDTYHFYDIDLSPYPQVGPGDYKVAFDAEMSSDHDYFYVDDLEIIDYSYLYVDDLKIGDEGNVYKIEVAYTDASIGSAWMDRLGVWLPTGFEYVDVIETNGMTTNDPDTITPSYRGGTALEWEFAPAINLFSGGQLPEVKDITFRFKPADEPKGIFSWIRAYANSDGTGAMYESWDGSTEIYKATSTASHSLSGTSTRVEAYVVQGEMNRESISSYGNYVATGSTLMIDANGDANGKRETSIDGDPQSYAEISSISSDAEVVAAWLYWSAFQQDSSVADEVIDFMHPKRYYGEALGAAWDLNGDDIFNTINTPVVTLPREEVVYLSPKRYRGELLGEALLGNGNETFNTIYSPIIELPRAEYVYLDGSGMLTAGGDYDIDYGTGQVRITNDTLSGNITIDYSVAGLDYLTRGTDYDIDYATGEVTITNDVLVGNVSVDYNAEKWDTVTHEAYNKYGMSLDPVVEENFYSGDSQGWSYASFSDVTDLVEGNGNGEFAVRNVDATPANESRFWGHFSYSGWSLIIVYESPSETAHQLYLYDPIHNAAEIPFYSEPDDDVSFTLSNFYPPNGVVEGKLTYFVGEGDDVWDEDYIQIKGASQGTFTNLSDPPNNPEDNVINAIPTIGVSGIDIDTFEIVAGDVNIGSDTAADVEFSSATDAWNLIYLILSFKTDTTYKESYTYSVGTLMYNYEVDIGG